MFVATIAQAAGTATNAVIDLMVTDSSHHASSATTNTPNTHTAPNVLVHLRAGAKSISIAEVNLQYTIQLATSSGMTYDQLSTRLVHSVESGEFTALLHLHAMSLNVHALYAATCSTITTKNTTPSQPTNTISGSSSGLSVAAIVGIVLGVCAVVAVCVCVFVLWYQWRKAKMHGLLHVDTLHRQSNKSNSILIPVCVSILVYF